MKTWMLGAALLSAGCSLWHSTDRDRDSSPSKPGMTDAGGDGDESDAAEPPQPPDAQVLPDAGPAEHDADVPTGPDGCVAQEVYEDYDGDGHGNALRVRLLCDVPEGWSLSSNDCDDQDPAVWKETELGCIPPGPLSCKYKEPYCDPLSTCFDEGNEGRCICPGTHVDVASDGSDCRPAFRDAMSFGQFESDDRLLDLTRDAQGNLWMASEVWGKTWLGNQLVGGEHFTTVLGKFSPDLDVLYAQSFEGPVSFASLAVDENGDLWWAGLFDGTANFGGATHTAPSGRAFVARRHPDGSHAFSTAFAGEGNSAAYALATRGDSLFVAGSFAGTINLSNDEAPEAELVSQGGQDVFVAELDLAGNHRWSTSFGGAGDEFPRALSAGPEGLSVLVDFTRELTL